jgi:hypothetical protein
MNCCKARATDTLVVYRALVRKSPMAPSAMMMIATIAFGMNLFALPYLSGLACIQFRMKKVRSPRYEITASPAAATAFELLHTLQRSPLCVGLTQ